MKLDSKFRYGNDPYTLNHGADRVREMFIRRYGDKYIKYREDWIRTQQYWLPDFPLNLLFDPIDSCNLKCPQCLRADDLIGNYENMLGTKKAVPLEVINRYLDEAAANGMPSADLGGSGEATLHPDFLKIVKSVMDHDIMEFRIVSNGLRLTEEIGEALIDMQVHMLSVSIDGFSPETYKISRGGTPILYERCIENVRKFAELKKRRGAEWPLLRVSFAEQAANAHEKDDFVRYWSDYADLVDVQAFADYRATDGFKTDFDCYDPFKRLVIWGYGGVGPCCGFPGIVYKVGDWTIDSIRDIWHGEGMKSMREMMVNKTYEKACLNCRGTRTII